MKGLFILIIGLLICFPIFAQDKTDREQERLKGKVKTIEAYRIEFSSQNGKPELSNRTPLYIRKFNPAGNLTEKISYDPDGGIQERLVYNFDGKNRNIGYDEYYTIKNKLITIPRKHVYTLDDKGNRIEYRILEAAGSSAGRFTYKYDSKGNKIEDGYYYHTGEFGGRTVYTYDANGNQISQIYYNAEGAVVGKIISTYNSQGNKLEQLRYRGEVLTYKIINKYDGKQRIIETETIALNAIGGIPPTHSPIPGKIIYRYDDKKRTKDTIIFTPNGKFNGRFLIIFDNRNNEIERYNLTAEGTEIPDINYAGRLKTEYDYDSHGNWTKLKSLYQGNNMSFKANGESERLITYYR